jgi:hypothetical protein
MPSSYVPASEQENLIVISEYGVSLADAWELGRVGEAIDVLINFPFCGTYVLC